MTNEKRKKKLPKVILRFKMNLDECWNLLKWWIDDWLKWLYVDKNVIIVKEKCWWIHKLIIEYLNFVFYVGWCICQEWIWVWMRVSEGKCSLPRVGIGSPLFTLPVKIVHSLSTFQ